MALEETIREMIKEELASQLEEIRKQVSSVSSRIETVDVEMNKKWSLFLKLRKYTLDQLMLEYRKVKDEWFPKSEDLNESAEI